MLATAFTRRSELAQYLHHYNGAIDLASLTRKTHALGRQK